MDLSAVLLAALLMGVAAALYVSVGHGGASAYLAIMGLLSVPDATMRPTALVLNLVVAGFGSFRYLQAGCFNRRLFLAFAAPAIPCAFIGGAIDLPSDIYRPLVGVILWLAALRLLWKPASLAERPPSMPPLWLSIPGGAVIGLLAGLTGTGGGIFLSPLIIYFGWEQPRQTSGVAAAFIFLNSTAGLLGNLSGVRSLPAELPIFGSAVAAGALIGTWLGVKKLPSVYLLHALGLVLLIAGGKLIFW